MKSSARKLVKIETAKELDDAIEQIYTSLADIKIDWKLRMYALNLIKVICLSNFKAHDKTAEFIKKTHPLMQIQLLDLRSQIAIEACNVVSLMAETFNSRFESECEKYISNTCLLKLINNANGILAESGHKCIQCLITHVVCAKIIPKVLEEYSSKNKEARARVLQYVRDMLGNYPSQMFEKYMGLLTKVISNSLTDSHPNARSVAREVYLKFEELYPKKAEEILRQLPLIAQKYIEEAKFSGTAHCKTPNPVRVKDKRMTLPKKVTSNDDSNIQINIIPDTNSHNAQQQSPEDEEAKVILSIKGRTVHSKSQKKQKSLQESSFDDILIDIESKVWSRRVEAIEEIIEILKNSIECTNNGQLSKAIQVIVAHMSDVHASVDLINR